MGALISRWKAKPSTVELLEALDKDIKDLEEFRAKNQRMLKLWVGRLLFYSSVTYLLCCVCVYYCYLPDDWSGRIIMALPLFLFPVLVWFMRKLLIFLFSKRTERNNEKLEDLKSQKRKILEEVMETETYKNAKLILERFDPESKKKSEAEATPGPQMTPRPDLRQRNVPMGTPQIVTTPGPRLASPSAATPLGAMPCPAPGQHPPGPQLPRPILPRERSSVDRVIEYLVGDGPQNRYALICQQCFSHNGMALKEEFEFVAYRCAYCYFLNPARKTRPQAPRLPEFSFERRLRSESPATGSSAASESPEDSDAAAEHGGVSRTAVSGSSCPQTVAVTPWSKVHSFTQQLPTEEPDGDRPSDNNLQHDMSPSTQNVVEELEGNQDMPSQSSLPKQKEEEKEEDVSKTQEEEVLM
ncbi:endoplasmic reticulum junction formation protein lunapark-B isoform X2 [Denticeps clupeoides]|uniref:endoplasmic reticulum junction formation protein lunapark-B isoform X2 n=1 Tax=Denticeps clupeoides TaxID=299321 RepID=UPI0010A37687|nr:endoplasmic reticulum junction formation protein lunapark-B-like isoform X2 [Denticeps clupeoides]